MLTVSLPPELEQLVNERIASGQCGSAGEVVREALLLLRERDIDRQQRLEELRRETAVGIDQLNRGDSAPLDIEAIKAEGRRLLAGVDQTHLTRRQPGSARGQVVIGADFDAPLPPHAFDGS
jgi:antitoxin ParD1/3/4